MPAGPGKLVYPNMVLPLFGTKRILTDAEISAIFTTPITIVPAVPGHVIEPWFGHLFRPAGIAWTAGAFTGLRAEIGAGVTKLGSFNSNILTGAAPITYWMRAGATGTGVGSTAFSCVDDFTSLANVALNIAGVGGNPSNGTGGLEVTIFYHLIPARIGLPS